MQNTFYLAENVNTHKQTAKGTCKGARRKNPNQTHNKQKACEQLLFLQEPDFRKCSELTVNAHRRLRRGKRRKEEKNPKP